MDFDKTFYNNRKSEIYSQDFDKFFEALHLRIDILRYSGIPEIKKKLERQYFKIYAGVKDNYVKTHMEKIEKLFK
jgi:hypothetical protein